MSSSNPITQVSQSPMPNMSLQPQLLTRLHLDLRGVRFTVDRETIMNLPESVLLCLFPNGLVLSRQSVALSDGGDEEDDEVYGVDVRMPFDMLDAVFMLSSLTPNVSILFSISSAMQRIRFMEQPRSQAFLLCSSICWMPCQHPPTTLCPSHLRHKIRYLANKPLSFFARSWNILPSRHGVARRKQTARAIQTMPCLNLNVSAVKIYWRRGPSLRPCSGT